MRHTNEARVQSLENRLLSRQCETCWGARSLIVHVPEGEDPASPRYNPTHCDECGKPLQHITQIIGVSEEMVAGLHAKSAKSAG